jgi:hypothetical protein
MSAMLKTCATSLLLAASFAALAADDTSTDASAPSATLGQVAVRDAATGQLRAPTASEMKALQAAAPIGVRTMKAGATRQKHHQSGATGARLNDSFMSYSVVVKQPDGKLAEYCFASQEDAEAAVAAPVSATPNQPTE